MEYLSRLSHRQSELLLIVVFLAVVVPVALVRRLFGRSLIDRSIEPSWHDARTVPTTLADLRRMF